MKPTSHLSGAASAITLTVLLALAPIPARSADKPDAQSPTTVFRVAGALLESACSLAMDSKYQEIWLGEAGTAQLQRAGDQGTPIAIALRLRGCIRSEGGRRDEHAGTLVWSAAQPVVGITFRAPADMDNPDLASVTGASGFGLRLTDINRQPIALNKSSSPWFVQPGDSLLTYYVVPERTAAPLRAGPFHAYLNVHLTYD